MKTGTLAQRVPRNLRVHVGVDIDEAGAHDVALGIDRALGLLATEITDLGDQPITDCNVSATGIASGAVNHHAVRNN